MRLALDLYGQQINCPLHLHLTEFNLKKHFRGQSVTTEYKARPLAYFYETLDRLNLKFPSEMNISEPVDLQKDQEFEDAINR